MSRPWVKSNTNELDDVEMMLLSDSAYRRYHQCYQYAGQTDDGGRIAPLNYIAIKCRVTLDQAQADLQELAAIGRVHFDAGEWYISNWADEQPAETVKDRVRRSRASKNKEETPEQPDGNDTSNSDVTLQERDEVVLKKELELKLELELELEEEKNPPKSPQGGKVIEIPQELDTPEFQAAWDRWKQYRREIRKTLKPTTIRSQLKTLAGWGEVKAIQALDNSITNGWTGIFEPDPAKTNGYAPPVATEQYIPDANGRF